MWKGNFPSGYKKRAQSSNRSIKQLRKENAKSRVATLFLTPLSNFQHPDKFLSNETLPTKKHDKKGPYSFWKSAIFRSRRQQTERNSDPFQFGATVCEFAFAQFRPSDERVTGPKEACERRDFPTDRVVEEEKFAKEKKWAENVPKCSAFEYWKVHVSRTVRMYNIFFLFVRYCSMLKVRWDSIEVSNSRHIFGVSIFYYSYGMWIFYYDLYFECSYDNSFKFSIIDCTLQNKLFSEIFV